MSTIITESLIPAGTYNVDPAHSNVGFEVRHMGIATVRGSFRRFEGTLDASGNGPVLWGSVEVASIDTGEAQRDGHLLAPDMFDAQAYPTISFHSIGTKTSAGSRLQLSGEITIKGVTKPIELRGTVLEGGQDPWGNERVGLELETTIDRRDFNLNFNQTLPSGKLLISDEVKLVISVSAVKAS
jgi:polyisoprenoid-binding protein YceI